MAHRASTPDNDPPAPDDIPLERRLGDASHALWEAIQDTLTFPEDAHPRGLGPRATRAVHAGSVALLLLFAVGWTWSIADARAGAAAGGDDMRSRATLPITSAVVGRVATPAAPSLTYLLDAATSAASPPRGLSGKLAASVQEPGAELSATTLPHGADYVLTDSAGQRSVAHPADSTPPPGVWRLAVALGDLVRPLDDFQVITLRPLAERRGGRMGRYMVGTWPSEFAARKGYRTPAGLIEVTPENQLTALSEHFVLRDFLTKGQADVWPKYLLIDTRLVDKLELVLTELRGEGIDTRGVVVMSGFRTPQYNVAGGDPRGRAQYSRHVYGDAADVFIDNDGNGRMDDLNGDGRVDLGDARVILRAVERVERQHSSLVGGTGIYAATSGHGPFVHIDTRGYVARWTEGASE